MSNNTAYGSSDEERYWNMYYSLIMAERQFTSGSGGGMTPRPPTIYNSVPPVITEPTIYRGIVASPESQIKALLRFDEIREYTDEWDNSQSSAVDETGREWEFGGAHVHPEGVYDEAEDVVVTGPFGGGVFNALRSGGEYQQAYCRTGHSVDFAIGTQDFTVAVWVRGTHDSPSDEGYEDYFYLPVTNFFYTTTMKLRRESNINFAGAYQMGLAGLLDADGYDIYDGIPDKWECTPMTNESGPPPVRFNHAWIHVALVRKQGMFSLYLHGKRYGEPKSFAAGIAQIISPYNYPMFPGSVFY